MIQPFHSCRLSLPRGLHDISSPLPKGKMLPCLPPVLHYSDNSYYLSVIAEAPQVNILFLKKNSLMYTYSMLICIDGPVLL